MIEWQRCPVCGGSGFVSHDFYGAPRATTAVYVSTMMCRTCQGQGVIRRAEPPSPSEPTPEALEAWAEWFDDPNKSTAIACFVERVGGFHTGVSPGYLLREIARRLREAGK